MDLQNYFPVLLFIIVATLIGLALLAAGRILGPNRPYDEKLSPYECGFEAFGDSRMKIDIRYYLIAILFIMFDLEIAFLFPWAIAQGAVGIVGFWTVMVFLLVLTVGFIYEWKKGALDWE
ncbi:NADH-quinone oxidoreductase subunit A [Paenalcaligenes faecalis]|uniref:NADH-quinone oxidoreductase subunit A n=1 Tax=Paenalcaligenes faecalis TaxID=2980099 RepID=UPI0022B970EF|nr:NADH-quinone oxidoreductase subunit A [Paenalcaligenes faecalis]